MHTPAPWIIDDCVPGREIGYRAIVAGDIDDREAGEIICYPSPMGEANARLIAAAPELLATCRELLELHIAHHNEPVHAAARAAIARATGET